MNDEILAGGLMLVNQLLRRAAEVSARMQAGTLDRAYLDAQQVEDAQARQRQLDALERSRAQGR